MVTRAFAVLRATATIGLLGVVLSMTGCATACACAPRLTPAPGAITKEAAIAAAKQNAPPSTSDPSVIWAQVATNPFAQGQTDRQLVWEVRLQSGFAMPPCASGFLDRYPTPSDMPCLDGDGGLVAVLDQFSGSLLGWTH